MQFVFNRERWPYAIDFFFYSNCLADNKNLAQYIHVFFSKRKRTLKICNILVVVFTVFVLADNKKPCAIFMSVVFEEKEGPNYAMCALSAVCELKGRIEAQRIANIRGATSTANTWADWIVSDSSCALKTEEPLQTRVAIGSCLAPAVSYWGGAQRTANSASEEPLQTREPIGSSLAPAVSYWGGAQRIANSRGATSTANTWADWIESGSSCALLGRSLANSEQQRSH